MHPQIYHDPTLNDGAGYLDVTPAAKAKPIVNPHGNTLLNLIHCLVYTFEGRELMRKNGLNALKTALEPSSRTNLENEFRARGVTDERVLSALVASHEAALLWKVHNEKGDQIKRSEFEQVYLQHTAFLTWCLWEDAKGHEFSLTW